MLDSARISGQREHHGEIVAKAEWPAIITPAETQRLRAKLGDPDRRTNRSARRYLLPALLRCGHCGEQARSRGRAPTARAAMSARAARASAAAARQRHGRAGRAVRGRGRPAPARLARASASPERQRRPIPPAKSGRPRSSAPRSSWTSWPTMWGKREITPRRVARRPRADREAPRHREAAASRRSTARPCLHRYVGNAQELREQWETMTLSRQQQIVAAVLEHVVVGPGAARLQPLRPGSLDRRLALLSPSARAARPPCEAPRVGHLRRQPLREGASPRPRPAPARVARHPAQAHQ